MVSRGQRGQGSQDKDLEEGEEKGLLGGSIEL